jgi:hypothetical protein
VAIRFYADWLEEHDHAQQAAAERLVADWVDIILPELSRALTDWPSPLCRRTHARRRTRCIDLPGPATPDVSLFVYRTVAARTIDFRLYAQDMRAFPTAPPSLRNPNYPRRPSARLAHLCLDRGCILRNPDYLPRRIREAMAGYLGALALAILPRGAAIPLSACPFCAATLVPRDPISDPRDARCPGCCHVWFDRPDVTPCPAPITAPQVD